MTEQSRRGIAPDRRPRLDRLKGMTGPAFDREFTQKLGMVLGV